MTAPTRPPTTEQIRAAWDGLAPGFDQYVTPASMAFGERVLARLGLRPGQRFLDVATGCGALAVPAARAGADVVAVDLAPTMIERLAARARTEGLTRIEARVMDGHALELADDTFDASASLNGVSLFPEISRGLAEMARVTRPGGTVLIAAFRVPQKVEFIGWFVRAAQTVVPDFPVLPTDPPPLPFQVSDPDRLRQVLSEAGLTSVAVETVTWEMRVESGRQLIDGIGSSNPIGAKWLSGLSAQQIDEIERVLDGMLRERSGGAPGAVLRNETNIGVGTK